MSHHNKFHLPYVAPYFILIKYTWTVVECCGYVFVVFASAIIQDRM